MEKVLIVVDMQNDFIDGVWEMPEARVIIGNVVNKIKTYQKSRVYATMNTQLANTLSKRFGKSEVEFEFVGLCTDVCVISNALLLKAYMPEARIVVDSSCCAGITPESHEVALTIMKMCQIEVI